MFTIYSILYSAALFFIAPFEYFRRHAALRGRWLRERFGFYQSVPEESKTDRKVVWIHAVSVGEVAASVSFVKKLHELRHQTDIVVSTVTDTGQKVAMERMGGLARIIYIPFDLPCCITRAVKHIKPDLFIIMETEIWPNIIRGLARRGVPIMLMNGRISEKSFKGYLSVKFFISPILRQFDAICMQDEQYAERIRLLGASPDRVSVTGNFKFDMRPSSDIPEWTKALIGSVIIAGSTHHTEEDIALDAYETLLADMPGLNLVLAPRHPERFAEVEELVIKRHLRYLKRSEIKDKAEERKPGRAEAQRQRNERQVDEEDSRFSGLVIILDVIGELASVYGAADIAIMGGSFISRGGQNPLEPAYWGKAVICGPHMENFPFMDEFYAEGAALKTDSADLASRIRGLLAKPDTIASMGRTARRLYEKNTGATDKAITIVRKYI
jgi:3-deoxy-D-manno-octulosonic-acid transferase